MRDGFIKVACATPKVKVADVKFNVNEIVSLIYKLNEQNVKLAVFPELSITGASCGDLFFQESLERGAISVLCEVLTKTANTEVVAVLGLPFNYRGKLYNTAAVIYRGKILGLVPKLSLSLDEKRYFTSFLGETVQVKLGENYVPFGKKMLFFCEEMPKFCFYIEFGDELQSPRLPSSEAVLSGATLIANLSSSNEVIGKAEKRRILLQSVSEKLHCGYIYANVGKGESTTDLIFSGHSIIAENGEILAESELFFEGATISELDVEKLSNIRVKDMWLDSDKEYLMVPFSMAQQKVVLTRRFSKLPFFSEEKLERDLQCKNILLMQSMALAKRVEHISATSLVVGLSGGLDSCLAVLVAVKAMNLLNRDAHNVIAVTMPCFGTSDRTKGNAENLAKLLKVTFRNIDIKNSVLSHFKDIGQDLSRTDVTYENAQARERTQVLMDIANQNNGIVVGTGDLSELALGWATYNGDHMSMYGVNSSIPKTLIRHVVAYYAEKETEDIALRDILQDILDTPVSPELLPGENISQKTEDFIGPYELNDFFLYYMVGFGFPPKKILRLAKLAFEKVYAEAEIKRWLKNFYSRFFNGQFKRSCLPDGVQVTQISLSPRNGWKMPSDACCSLWMNELE